MYHGILMQPSKIMKSRLLAAIWMELEAIIISEMTQRQKARNGMFSFGNGS